MKLRKNVYVADLQKMPSRFADYFAHQKESVLPLVSVNGKIIQNDEDSSIPSKSFPNPATSKMLSDFYTPTKIITKFSTIIVEYLDINNTPVLYLFPNGTTQTVVVDAKKKMNNKMRRDLAHQIKLRKNLIAQTKTK